MQAGKQPIDVNIHFELSPDVGEVDLIPEDFSRVVVNLCNNAFDAMRMKTLTPPYGHPSPSGRWDGEEGVYKPKLTVLTKSENDHILISVKDNGPGIPEELMDKILQPFFTTKKGTEGTGLGLSITHDIVKAHGGELTVETKEGQGSTFIIQLTKNT
jgi:signal transduction histidine kinase